ncbi:MAG: sigma-70 family RNA polymerase sigma factor [Candidatus Bipolaricaulota bacterium]
MTPDESNEQLLQEIQRLEDKLGGTSGGEEERIKNQLGGLKDQLARQNIGLVKSIVKDYLHSGFEFDDLMQAGYLGLLNAAENFDLSRGTKFSTYATYLIKGEIRHHIRDNAPVVHVPQWISELNQDVQEAQERIYNETGELPSIQRLSEELNIEEDGIREVLKARDSMTYVSIDEQRRKSDPRPEYIDYEKIRSKHEEDLPIEYKVRIAQAIEKLTQVQQEVVKGLFFDEDTQEKVGDDIGVSQRQVSRIKKRVLKQIENYLKEDLSKNPEEEE